MNGVRYREDTGWEMRCDDCKASGRTSYYWPLLPYGEFWGKCRSRCVACERTRIATHRRRTSNGDRGHNAARDFRRRAAARARRRYYLHREEILSNLRAKYAADRERILAERKRRYYEKKAA